jgi:hypothetical protein
MGDLLNDLPSMRSTFRTSASRRSPTVAHCCSRRPRTPPSLPAAAIPPAGRIAVRSSSSRTVRPCHRQASA